MLATPQCPAVARLEHASDGLEKFCPHKLSHYEWLTLKCFGRLREAVFVSLLMPASSQLGTFIGAQDAVKSRDEQSSGIQLPESQRLLVSGFASLHSDTFLSDVEACHTY